MWMISVLFIFLDDFVCEIVLSTFVNLTAHFILCMDTLYSNLKIVGHTHNANLFFFLICFLIQFFNMFELYMGWQQKELNFRNIMHIIYLFFFLLQNYVPLLALYNQHSLYNGSRPYLVFIHLFIYLFLLKGPWLVSGIQLHIIYLSFSCCRTTYLVILYSQHGLSNITYIFQLPVSTFFSVINVSASACFSVINSIF